MPSDTQTTSSLTELRHPDRQARNRGADLAEAGKTALAAGESGPSSRQEQLESEVTELTEEPG